jgi:hypothetical protein
MNRLPRPIRRIAALGVFLILGVWTTPALRADNPKSQGAIDFSPDVEGQATFILRGTTPDIGRFTSYGEIDFAAGEEEEMLHGTGVAVVTAANGDQLVGVVTCRLDRDGALAEFHFSWRDSVELRDGTTVATTGRFLAHRPPGLIVHYRVVEVIDILGFTFVIVIV